MCAKDNGLVNVSGFVLSEAINRVMDSVAAEAEDSTIRMNEKEAKSMRSIYPVAGMIPHCCESATSISFNAFLFPFL